MIAILIGWDLLEWASPKENRCCCQLATAARAFKDVLIDRKKQGLPGISAVAAGFEAGVKTRTIFEIVSVLRGWEAIETPANAMYKLR